MRGGRITTVTHRSLNNLYLFSYVQYIQNKALFSADTWKRSAVFVQNHQTSFAKHCHTYSSTVVRKKSLPIQVKKKEKITIPQ